MDFGLSAEQQARKKEFWDVCKKLSEKIPKDLPAGVEMYGNEKAWAFHQFCAKEFSKLGWLALAWPKEYGGTGNMMDKVLLGEARGYWRIMGMDPIGLGMLAPTLAALATDEIKKKFLPPMARAETTWCELYSEPNAGSDLAGLSATAIKKGNEYVVNGQKIWTSGAHKADWGFGLFKTDLQAPPRKNISFLLLSMKTPGITIRPILFMNGDHFYNEVFFDDVRVPADQIVGQENGGWNVANTLLEFERSNMEQLGGFVRDLEELVEYCNVTKRNGHPLSKDPTTRRRIAQIAIDLEASRCLAHRVADMQNRKEMSLIEAGGLKIFTGEFSERMAYTITDILGPYGQIKTSRWAPLNGAWEAAYQTAMVTSVAMGSNEIQKNVIAWYGLGLPRK
jgi:alkylation response protein AidB-like acyl-CoA dehydrogenase